MALSAADLDVIYQRVLFRPVDPAGIATFANRTDISDAQVRQQIETSNEANANVSPVVRLFDAALGRVPDTAGLRFFVTNNRGDSSAIATQILNSTEFSAVASANGFAGVNGTSASSAAFVQYLFSGILGRAASATDVSFFTAPGRTAASVLTEIANSGEAVNRNAAGVVTFLDSVALGTPNVGSLEAQQTTGGAFVGPNAFTTGTDALVGGTGNDLFIGTAANVATTDSVNGGAGTDTVRIVGATGAVALPTLNSVEILDFTAPTGALTVNAAAVTGLNFAVVRNYTTGGGTNTFNIKSGVGIGLDNVTSGAVTINAEAGTTAQSVFLANGSNTGALTLTNAGGGAALTNLRIDSAGTKANTIASVSVEANTKTLDITGAQKLTITGALDTDITTVNAGTTSGGVTLTAGANAVSITGGSGNDRFVFAGNLGAGDRVVGGAGTDTVSITGVDLTDAANAAQLTALNTQVSGVEVLEFTGTTSTIQGGTGTGAFTNTEITKLLYNTSGADIINNAGSARLYAIGEDNGGDLTANLLPNTATVNFSLEGLSAVTGGAGANGANVDVLAVNLNTAAPAGSVATVNIASTTTSLETGAAVAANTIGTLTAVVGSTYNITGAAETTVGTLSNAGTINATALTGKFGLTTGASGNTVVNLGSGGTVAGGVNTGAGIDTITATGGANTLNSGANNDTITGGSGVDTINGGADADILTGGAGNDIFVFTSRAETRGSGVTNTTAFAATDTTAANIDRITDFVGNGAAAGDTINLGGGAAAFGTGITFTGTTTATVTASTVATAGTFTALTAAVQAANAGTASTSGAAQIYDVTVTAGSLAGRYLIVNDETAAIAATDTIINITGVTGALNAQDFTFA